MGLRGPAPKPTATKVLQGTFRKDRAPKNEPQPRLETPSCPSHLKGEARREWKRIVPELEAANLLTIVDRAALAAYCQSWARWVEAEKALEEHGLTYDMPTKSGAVILMPRPEVAISNEAKRQMKVFLAEFGMTPSSRTRINVQPPAPKPAEDPWGEFKREG